MSYLQLAYYHLASVFPAFFIGTYSLCSHKGTPIHKLLCKVYMVLMFVTALITLLMPAKVGARFLGHFGFIHLLSLSVIYSVPMAWLAARRRSIS